MADIAVTAAQIAFARQPIDGTIIRPYIAGAAITAGQSVYVNSSGTVDLGDANAAGKEQFRGIALQTVGAGQAVDVLERGVCEGFAISGLAYDALVYQSDTAGSLADAASGTKTIRVGRVVPTTTRDSSGNIKKILYVQADMLNNW